MADGEKGMDSGTGASSSGRRQLLPQEVLDVICGKKDATDGKMTKAEAYNNSLRKWWGEYSDRKNDEEEHPCDSLYYDRNTLPRMTPAPDVVARRAPEEKNEEKHAK
mmetsp:Transcript_2135/g.4948  ORF Transcript_2135/g.4948 Transcript_2135/m.4948 type:complete len:107 (-) Transcript_2135:346-666(-)